VVDTGFQYRRPTAAANPCLYNENTRGGTEGIFDAWGAFDKQFPQFNDAGALGVGGVYGLEVSFLARVRAVYPSWNLAFIKQSVGGTSLRGDWLPNTVTIGTAQSGTSSTIRLAATDPSTAGNTETFYLRINSGTGAGQQRQVTAYNASTKVATVTPDWTTPPDATSGYGIERKQFYILRTMYEQAAARLVAAGHTFEVAAFIWMQGENGAHGSGIAVDGDDQYLADSRGLYAAVRSMTGTANLPVLIGRIGNNWTNTNTYLTAAGYPWAAIDASYHSAHGETIDGRIAAPQTDRDAYLADALARRATQATLGADPHCAMWDNDDYPVVPPYWTAWASYWGETIATSTIGQKEAFHWASPGNLTAGERAFPPFQRLITPTRRLPIRAGGRFLVLAA
jgi:hypothetical protein